MMDKLRDMAATGVRIGSGWGASIPAMEPGPGSLAGAGIAGLGEGAAELIEGSPLSPARIGTEAALGAVPLGRIFKAGKVVESGLRSGMLSGVGTGMREISRGEKLNPSEIMNTSLIGMLTGGALGHLTGGASKGPLQEFDTIEQAGGNVKSIPRTPPAAPGQAPPVDPRTAYFARQGKNPPAGPGQLAEMSFTPDEAAREAYRRNIGPNPPDSPESSGVHTPYGVPAAPSQRPSAKASIKAEADAIKAKQIEDVITEAGLLPGEPRISRSISAPTEEGGTIRQTTPYKAPVADSEGGGGATVAGRRIIEDIPIEPAGGASTAPTVAPTGSTATPQGGEELYQAWRQRVGLPDTQSSRRDFPWGLVGGEPTIDRPRGEPTTVPEPPPAPARTPLAEVLTPASGKPRTLKQQAQEESFAALQAKLSGETVPTVPQEALPQALETPPVPEVTPSLPIQAAAQPEATQSPLARFFKTRVDASGQANRDIKAAKALGEVVPEEGRAATGQALQREAQAAGLPVGKAARTQAEPTATVTGVGQTSKAREAALAARVAKRAQAPPVEPQLNPQELAQKFRELGREDLAQQIESQAPKLGGETGQATIGGLAMLLRAGIGAGVGGAMGGAAGHPLLGAVAGAGVGAFGPAALSSMAGHLSAAGAPPEVINALPNELETSGVKETARKIWHTLPQIQRFNFLADLPSGLFANAAVGPYGSAVMGALEHGLSGDERGWAALKLLTPQRFAQEMKASMAEAGQRIAEGEMGRAESSTSLFKPINIPGFGEAHPMQLPGQTMTSGDIAAKRILGEAGFDDMETQRITLTSEPEAALPKGFANLGRGKRDWSTPLGELMLPFKRTPANIWEQGAQRMPGIGFAVQAGREVPDPIKQQIIQQLMSTGVGVGAGVLGANVDPETAKVLRRYVSNAAGQYSLPATIGFAAGQAIQGGKPAITAGVSAGVNQLPLPATQPITDIAAFLSGEGRAPRGIAPPFIRDIAFPPTQTGSTTGGYDALPGVPSLRSLKGF